MRVHKIVLKLLGFSLIANPIAAGAQGLAEYGAVNNSAAARGAGLNGAQGALTGAFGSAFSSAVNSLNVSPGGSGFGMSSHRKGSNSELDKEGPVDPAVAKQWLAFADKLVAMAQQKEKVGKLKEAEQLYRQALPYRERILGKTDSSVVRLYDIIGGLSRKRRALDESVRCYNVVLMSTISKYGQGSYDEVPVLNKLGQVHSEEMKYSDAAKDYRLIYKLEERKHGPQDRRTTQAALNLSRNLMEYPETAAEAVDLLKKCVDTLEQSGDSKDPLLLSALDSYAVALRKTNKADEANKVQTRADEVRKAIAASKSAAAGKADDATEGGAQETSAAENTPDKNATIKDSAAKNESGKDSRQGN